MFYFYDIYKLILLTVGDWEWSNNGGRGWYRVYTRTLKKTLGKRRYFIGRNVYFLNSQRNYIDVDVVLLKLGL